MTVYLKACPKCRGDVDVDFREGEAQCVQCGFHSFISSKPDEPEPKLMQLPGEDKKSWH